MCSTNCLTTRMQTVKDWYRNRSRNRPVRRGKQKRKKGKKVWNTGSKKIKIRMNPPAAWLIHLHSVLLIFSLYLWKTTIHTSTLIRLSAMDARKRRNEGAGYNIIKYRTRSLILIVTIMQNEDDLRGLAKVTDFMRAISFLFLTIHIYWFCYGWLHEMGWTLGIVDKILSNFQRTTGLFSSLLYTKLFCVLFLGLSFIPKFSWQIDGILVFLNWWLLSINASSGVCAVLYITTLTGGFFCLLASGLWISRLLKNNLLEDVFNTENESFMQETRLMENEYSVNLPTKFWYKGKTYNGFINLVNIFRATMINWLTMA